LRENNIKNMAELLLEASKHTNKGITFILNKNGIDFLSYKKLLNDVLIILNNLQQNRLKKNDKLILYVDNNKYFIIYFWACILGGIIPVPVSVGNNDEHKQKLFKIIEKLDSPFVVTEKNIFKKIMDFASDNNLMDIVNSVQGKILYADDPVENINGKINKLKQEDIAFIQFSSGSTGDPKGVVLTHNNIITNIKAIRKGIKSHKDDSTLSWMPLTHDMGLIGFHLTPLAEPANQFLMPVKLFIMQPCLWFDYISRYKISITASPNFGYDYFLKHINNKIKNWDLSSVRLIFNGAEPIQPELCEKFLAEMNKYKLKKNVLFNVYGLAEASLAVSFPPVGEEFKKFTVNRRSLYAGKKIKLGNGENDIDFVDLGYPVKDCSLRICNEKKEILEDDIIGNIQIKGESIFTGYYEKQGINRYNFTENGWFITGDLGFLHNGRLVVTGRTKDILFINGQNYYSHDIERIAESIVGLNLGSAAVCSIYNDNIKKEELYLFVLFKKSLIEFIPLELKLSEGINRQIGLQIKKIIPVKKIFKTTSGKIQRYKFIKHLTENGYNEIINKINEIKKELFNADLNSNYEALSHDIKDFAKNRLMDIFHNVLENNNIRLNDNYFGFGINSINSIRIINSLREYGLELDIKDIYNNETIADLINYIKKSDKIDNEIVAGNAQLTPMQRYFINLNKNNPDVIHHWCPINIIFKENGFDEEVVNRVFNELINYHDALRIIFKKSNNKILQHNKGLEDNLFDLKIFDLKNTINYKKIIIDELNILSGSFNLYEGPLIKCCLFKTKEGDHLAVCIHHFIFDGFSFLILLEDFLIGYNSALNNKEIKFQNKTDSFIKWSDYIYEYAFGKKILNEYGYWKNINSYKTSVIPKDNIINDNKYKDALYYQNYLSDVSTVKLLEITKMDKLINVESILLFALGYTINNLYGEKSIIVEKTINSRNKIFDDINIARTIGWFSTSYPLIIEFNNLDSFYKQVKNIKDNCDNTPNSGIGYFILNEITLPETRMLPLFDIKPEILFIYHGAYNFNEKKNGISFSNIPIGQVGRWAHPDFNRTNNLVFTIIIINNRLHLNIDYNSKEFFENKIKNIGIFFIDSLSDIIDKLYDEILNYSKGLV